MNSISLLNRASDNMRILIASMVEKAKSGHPGGAMGGIDFLNVLYSEFLTYDPNDGAWFLRDRFFLDPGHMAPMLYSVLTLCGKFTLQDLANLRQWGSLTPGHPERNLNLGIENTSGPLGQGHTYAVGAAIADKFLRARFGDVLQHNIYAFISDGGIQEEISQGAGRLAGHLGLDNLIMFYDSNGIQLSTECAAVDSEDVEAKYRAWGWWVKVINGNDIQQIREAIAEAQDVKGQPALIIGKTIMGKGARRADGSSYENTISIHGAPLGGDNYRRTVESLGGNPDNPFVIWDDVQQLYDTRREQLLKITAERRAKFEAWKNANPDKASQLDDYINRRLPQLPWDVAQKPDSATRAASAAVLSMLAQNVGNMIVASADLSNSDKTDGFLKQTHAFTRGDFSGAFLQAGVSELTMACCCIGMALHGGVIPACGTFFVFSDYMKPAVRMAALMEVPVIFIWTHDAFRVGEDGPTHEPVEQEAQIRLMEHLQNHSGNNSMLVLRPADALETNEAWRLALENAHTPSALILSRQNIPSLPDNTEYHNVANGAYIVSEPQGKPDIVLIASGSEVSTLVAGNELLKQHGVKARIVSVPSEGLLRKQTADYQHQLLPLDIPRFGLTAGLPVTLLALVGNINNIWGLQSFGFSAPYKVLDEKLGFTADNVCKQVLKILDK